MLTDGMLKDGQHVSGDDPLQCVYGRSLHSLKALAYGGVLMGTG